MTIFRKHYILICRFYDIVIFRLQQPLKFNKSLYNDEAISSWIKILSWIGISKDEELKMKLAEDLKNSVNPIENSQLKHFRTISLNESNFGVVSIRPIMFSPERINSNNADKFINWKELNEFLWQCLCPPVQREMCGTRYDFTAWGELADIVRAYKNRQHTQTKFKEIEELYSEIKKVNTGSS